MGPVAAHTTTTNKAKKKAVEVPVALVTHVENRLNICLTPTFLSLTFREGAEFIVLILPYLHNPYPLHILYLCQGNLAPFNAQYFTPV